MKLGRIMFDMVLVLTLVVVIQEMCVYGKRITELEGIFNKQVEINGELDAVEKDMDRK